MQESVKIQVSAAGATVTAFATNGGKNGYVQVYQSTIEFTSNGWMREKKRSSLIRGEVALLKKVVTAAVKDKDGDLSLPGRICVQEYLESDIPANVAKAITNSKTGDYENSVKRAGEDGPELTCQGERIIRYAFYDSTCSQGDSKIDHDNVEEVKAWRESVASASAGLPGGN
jgi:hypothetical protein